MALEKEASLLCTEHAFLFPRTMHEMFVFSAFTMFKLVDLEAFPGFGVWTCPALTSSHVAAKLEYKLNFLHNPAATYPKSSLRPSFPPVLFLLPAVPPGAIG